MKTQIYRYLHRVTAPERAGVDWFDLIEIGLVAFGFLLYFVVRGAVIDRTHDALQHARWIVSLQTHFGFFVEPTINRWVVTHTPILKLVDFVYFWFDFPLIVAVGLLLFWRRRTSYTLLRDALLISGGLALIVYWTFPVAPPRYLKEWGFIDTLARFSHLAYQTQSTRPFVNPFAAVPSLHVGWSLLLAVVVFDATRNWWLRMAAFSVLALQALSVVATANHFIFDGVMGMLVALLALAAAAWLQRRGYPALRGWFARRADLAEAGVAARAGPRVSG